jgi:hypothetical protein
MVIISRPHRQAAGTGQNLNFIKSNPDDRGVTMTLSNIEPLARKIAERICRQHPLVNPSDPPMTEEDIATWVDGHWEAAAADLEAGIVDDDGNRIPGADWERGLAAYRERVRARK